MRKGENMVTLEKLRLREVALNSLLAKMGKDLRVKATVVRKNNMQKPAFGMRTSHPRCRKYHPA